MSAHRRADRGSALVMALVFVGVVALVVTSLLSMAHSNVRTTRVVHSYTDRTYAVDAALEHALQRVELDRTLCGSGAIEAEGMADVEIDVDGDGSGDADDITVDLSCQVISGAGSGNNGWAVIITGTGDDLETGGGVVPKGIDGPVYVAGGFNLSGGGDLVVSGGSVVRREPSPGTCPAQPSRLVVGPAPLFAYQCTAAGTPDPDHDLPTATMPARTGAPDPTLSTATCNVFLPGRYATEPQLVAQEDNYFASGDYYFHNIGHWQVPSGSAVDNTRVVAGAAPAGIEPELIACAADPAGTIGTGARFIFGGNSRFQTSALSRFEIFPRTGASDGAESMSIQAVTADAIPAPNPNGYVASSVTPPTAFLTQSTGTTPHLYIHGRLYAPNGLVELVPQNTSEVRLDGGVVARHLTLITGNATGFVVSARTSPIPRQVEIIASAADPNGGVPIVGRVTATFGNDAASTSQVDTWEIGRGTP